MAMLQARTKYGIVEGLPGFNQAVTVFKGIPYAAPPVGALRWKAPEACSAWEGVRQCYNYGNISYQARRPSEGGGNLIGDEFYCLDWPRSEDCLYLNVWTPAQNEGEKLPVAVYLHGGGYAQGYGHLNCYDGEGFNKRGVVMVSVNHRLGIFGYLAHPALSAENERGISGNYGLLDLVAALNWIKENIAAFGGDPEQISLFGQSGGGDKVKTLLLSPLSRDSIKGVVMQSGGGINRAMEEKPLAEAEKAGADIIKRLGYASIAEARAASQEELMEGIIALGNPMEMPFSPCIDGYALPENTGDMIEKGDYPDIPVMIGCTSQEFSSPEHPDDPMTAAFLASCTAYAKAHVRVHKAPVYRYLLTLVPPTAQTAHHSAEHHYVFQTLGKSKRPYTGRDWDLSNALADYWANFFKTGDPNGESFTGGSLPVWQPYTKEEALLLEIDYDLKMTGEPGC